MTQRMESFTRRIELVWCDVRNWHPSTKRTLYLTRRGCIVGYRLSQGLPVGAVEFGTFTRAIDLTDFREAIFHTLAKHPEISLGLD